MAKSKKQNNKKKAKDVTIEAPKAKVTAPSKNVVKETPLTFGRDNYIWMLIGFVVIVIGLLLMTGGAMPDPNVWDESIIYSFRRITLAPFVILVGLGIEIYAIFK